MQLRARLLRIHIIKFIFTIQDLFNDDGSAAGTKVILLIPSDFGSENQQI